MDSSLSTHSPSASSPDEDIAAPLSDDTLTETPTDAAPTERVEPVTETDWLTAGGIAVAFYLIGLWRLGTPSKMIFDEVYHARTGMQYIYGSPLTEWTHPPFAKLMIALSMLVWQVRFDPRDGAWKDSTVYPYHAAFAWRFPALVFGTGALIVLYVLARNMFGRRDIAATATCLLALDGVFFVQSRVAMTNIYTVFFVLLSTLGTYRYLKTNRPIHLLLTGLGIALALATRWSTVFVWGLTGVALLWHLFAVQIPQWQAGIADAREGRREQQRDIAVPQPPAIPLRLAAWAGVVIVCMFLIPFLVYMLAYIPDVLQGGGDWKTKLFTWNGLGGTQSWAWTLSFNDPGLQHNMWGYHSHMKDTHPYSSPWWQWPLMLRPVWYFFETDAANKVNGVWAIGNGIVWWLSVPALATAAYLGARERRPALGLLALLGLGQWLLWGVEPRSLVFMHYFFESLPYACIALAYLGWRLYDNGGKTGKIIATTLAVLAVLWAIFFYPLLSAFPIYNNYYQAHMWLGSRWI